MIVLDRREVGRFRAAVRRCVAGRPRSLAPPLVLQQDADGLTLSAVLDDVAIGLHLAVSPAPRTRLVIPFTTLAAIEGTGGGPVTLEESEPGRVRCRWLERGDQRELEAEALPADGELPSSSKLHAVDATLLPALHACGQTASREANGRFALTRLQLRGQAGQIVGTDGKQLLLWGGFTFPFQEAVLVPAVPVFGGKELAGEQDVRIGRTAQHVVVAAGPWTVWLTVDGTARYPDVTAVLPNASRMAKLVIHDADAAALLLDLQNRPTSRDEVNPVVLDLGARPALRWPEGTPGHRGPLSLIRSACSGPGPALTIDPQFLARALSLGFREVRGKSGDSPVLFRDEHRCYLVAHFGPTAPPAERPALPAPIPTSPLRPHGDEPMNPERTGSPPTDPSPTDDMLDPLTEAEALRVALAEVARRVGRLITALRQFQKQRRALHTVWTSLKHLRLGPQEEP